MSDSQLTIHDLSFERDNHTLFSKVNFTLAPGEMLQIQGANGSGKSSLLRILAGFLQPENGKVHWNGKCIFRYRENYHQQLHYLGHKNGVKPLLTVKENLHLHAALRSQKCSEENILEKLQLLPLQKKLAVNLSAGQRQRLALTRLLLSPLPLWILDEPATALDKQGQYLLTNMLEQHLKNNGSAIIATHHDFFCNLPAKIICLGEKYV